MDEKAVVNAVKEKLESYKEANTLERFEQKLDTILRNAGLLPDKDYYITTRYKNPTGIEEKVKRKGYTNPEQFTDLMGIRVICKKTEDVAKIQSLIHQNVVIDHEDDYYTNIPPSGYKSLHMIGETKGQGKIEIQVKDQKELNKAEYCHDRIYKNPKISKENRNAVNAETNKYMDELLSGRETALRQDFSKQELEMIDNRLATILQHGGRRSIHQRLETAKKKASEKNTQSRAGQSIKKERGKERG